MPVHIPTRTGILITLEQEGRKTRRVVADPNEALKAAIMLLAAASGLWAGDRLYVRRLLWRGGLRWA
jgi:hypothetical protein